MPNEYFSRSIWQHFPMLDYQARQYYLNIYDQGQYFVLDEDPYIVDEDGYDLNGNADPQHGTGYDDIITRNWTLRFDVGDFNNDGITDLLTYFVIPRINTPISAV